MGQADLDPRYFSLMFVRLCLAGTEAHHQPIAAAAIVAQEFGISSGTTENFETYDFDVYTRSLGIHGVFRVPVESISISEVRKSLSCIRSSIEFGAAPGGVFKGLHCVLE